MLGVVSYGLFPDYKYLFFVNDYEKPHGLWPRILTFWWSFHGGLWADRVLVPLAGLLILAASGQPYTSANAAPHATGSLIPRSIHGPAASGATLFSPAPSSPSPATSPS